MPSDQIKIPAMVQGVALTGDEEFECVQAGETRKIQADFFPSVGYSYLLVTAQPLLTASRRLTAGAGITLVDGGPGGDLTIVGSGSASLPVYWTTYESATLPVGDTNNYAAAADSVVLRITADAGGSALTGILATLNSGRMLVIINVGASGDLTIPHQSASSSAANRFTNIGAFDLIVSPGGSARYWYDPVSTTWRNV